MEDAETLLDQALTGEGRSARRNAFVALVGSDEWRLVLAPHVISQQGYELDDGYFPDRETFRLAAPAIASSEEKVQRVLELLGSRFSLDLCESIADQMGAELVELVLAHLRTAKDERAYLLQQVLNMADPVWVALPEARRTIRHRLRTPGPGRTQLMERLADAGNLGDFIEEVRESPPACLEEWAALGLANVAEESLINVALAILPINPATLPYLVRLDPAPPTVGPRIMAAARPDWLIQALEIAMALGLHQRLLIPLAELGVRLGGRPMAAATAWVGSARLGKELLMALTLQIVREKGRARLSDLIWVHRRAPSANRALEEGRKDQPPDPYDAAALVRQLRGDKVMELVQEILGKPRPAMVQPVLRPLCAVNQDAATEVAALCHSADAEIAARAQQARSWPDVLWPEEPPAGEP